MSHVTCRDHARAIPHPPQHTGVVVTDIPSCHRHPRRRSNPSPSPSYPSYASQSSGPAPRYLHSLLSPPWTTMHPRQHQPTFTNLASIPSSNPPPHHDESQSTRPGTCPSAQYRCRTPTHHSRPSKLRARCRFLLISTAQNPGIPGHPMNPDTCPQPRPHPSGTAAASISISTSRGGTRVLTSGDGRGEGTGTGTGTGTESGVGVGLKAAYLTGQGPEPRAKSMSIRPAETKQTRMRGLGMEHRVACCGLINSVSWRGLCLRLVFPAVRRVGSRGGFETKREGKGGGAVGRQFVGGWDVWR